MSMDPQEWARGQVPDPSEHESTQGLSTPVAPSGSYPLAAGSYPLAAPQPTYGQASPTPALAPAPYPPAYVAGAYGQRSAYGDYAPTSYGAGGYQPMPFRALPPLAGFGSRVGASLIDGIVPTVLVTIGFVAFVVTLTPTTDAFGAPSSEPTAPGLLAFLGAYLVAWGFSLWNRVFRQGRTGQSIGKSALHIRLVTERTMTHTGALLAFGREIAHYVDGAIYVGYLWPLWDAKNQTLADKICGTVVVVDG